MKTKNYQGNQTQSALNTAAAYADSGCFQEAVKAIKEILPSIQESMYIVDLINCYDAIGNYYFKLGQYSEAKLYNEFLLSIVRQLDEILGTSNIEFFVSVYRNLANAELAMENFPGAAEYYFKLFKELNKLPLDKQYTADTATDYAYAANLAKDSGNLGSAAEYYQKLFENCQKVPNHSLSNDNFIFSKQNYIRILLDTNKYELIIHQGKELKEQLYPASPEESCYNSAMDGYFELDSIEGIIECAELMLKTNASLQKVKEYTSSQDLGAIDDIRANLPLPPENATDDESKTLGTDEEFV